MENNGTTPAPIGPSEQSYDALKAVMLVVLFLCTFFISTASLPFRNFVTAHATTSPCIGTVFSLVSSFGAGVFLATCLLDMLPDALKSMAQAERRLWGPGNVPHFPLCAMFVSVGFLLVLLLEQVANCAIAWLGGGGDAATFFGGQQQQHRAVPARQYQHNRHDSQRTQLLAPTLLGPLEDDNVDDLSQRRQRRQQHQYEDAEAIVQQQQILRHHDDSGGVEENAIGPTESNGTNESIGTRRQCDFDVSTLRVLLLLLALNLHACCEGISIGTFTDVTVLFQIFIALLIHKSIVGFSLGIRLVQSNLCAPIIVCCCVLFAIQVLVGGFISLAIMDLFAGTVTVLMLAAIAQAIACGTFLYITTMEILPHELSSPHSSGSISAGSDRPSAHQQHDGFTTTMNAFVRSQKVAALLTGFLLICAFVAIFPDANDGNDMHIFSQ